MSTTVKMLFLDAAGKISKVIQCTYWRIWLFLSWQHDSFLCKGTWDLTSHVLYIQKWFSSLVFTHIYKSLNRFTIWNKYFILFGTLKLLNLIYFWPNFFECVAVSNYNLQYIYKIHCCQLFVLLHFRKKYFSRYGVCYFTFICRMGLIVSALIFNL